MLRRKVDLVLLLPLVCLWSSFSTTCDSHPIQSTQLNSQQWQSLIRDALKLIQQQHQHQEAAEQHKPNIRFVVDPAFSGSGGGSPPQGNVGTGMVKLRNIRSGFGDVANAVRLYQLHELEKEWASKARPRFGKRAEVTQDNFLPPYALTDSRGEDYDHQEQADGALVRVLPEDYSQDVVSDQLKVRGEHDPQQLMKYPEDYLIPTA